MPTLTRTSTARVKEKQNKLIAERVGLQLAAGERMANAITYFMTVPLRKSAKKELESALKQWNDAARYGK